MKNVSCKTVIVYLIALGFAALNLAGCGDEIHTYTSIKGDKGDVGAPGSNGTNGVDGANGHNSLISQAYTDNTLCPGSAVVSGNAGIVFSIGVDLDNSGSLDLSEVQQVAVVCNGANGANGADAPPTAFTPVGLIDPCGDAPGRFDEVFIKMSNGTVLASFSDAASGLNTRFSVLSAGSYVTTDGDNCLFSLNSSGTITYENHHY